MEYCRGGDVTDLLLHPLPRKKPPLLSRLHLAYQCALGMAVVHQKNLLHRDLKCDNLFITSQGVVKVGDFGRSRLNARFMTSTPGTPAFAAPETFLDPADSEGYGLHSDTYSWGHVLYSCMTCVGETPRALEEGSQQSRYQCAYLTPRVTIEALDTSIADVQQSGQAEDDQDPHTTDSEAFFKQAKLTEIYSLMTNCFHIDATKRPSFLEICDRMAKILPFEVGVMHYLQIADVPSPTACQSGQSFEGIGAQQFNVGGVKKQWMKSELPCEMES